MIHGKPYWGHRVGITGGTPDPVAKPVFNYELNGEVDAVDWVPYEILRDPAGVYISPQMTFNCYPQDIGPPTFLPPVAPLRLYYSHSGKVGTWLLVDDADWADGGLGALVASVRWPPNSVGYDIFDFLNIDPYVPAGDGFLYLMLTEYDPAFQARAGIPPAVTGVTPV